MLSEIKCELFREKKISFHSGLNVVLGDSVATNSIGKSTLLMVLDFVFAGNTFVSYNKDVIDEFGNHDYHFSFIFDDERYFFRRGTYESDLIYSCNDQYEDVEPLNIESYKTFLISKYNVEELDITFRSLASLFSRVWGKENLDVQHPLHNFKAQKASDCVTNTVKFFGKYESIKILSKKIKLKEDEASIFKKATGKGFIDKISARQYKTNLAEMEDIRDEINDIKSNLAKYAISITEIANKEIMELKEKKDNLLRNKLTIDSRLSRVRNDLAGNKNVTSKQLNPLLNFFPDVNKNRLNQVESFHHSITKILRAELKKSESELSKSLENVINEIAIIDEKIESNLSDIKNPSLIVDRVYNLSQKHYSVSSQIKFFEKDYKNRADLVQMKQKLDEEKKKILKLIESVLNDKIRQNVTKIYSEDRRSPKLSLNKNSYSFALVEDTGTGKAYSNLILLDIAFLELTKIPFLIHDSVLFKNIQNSAVAKLIDLYESIGKQTFIAIDEIQKYGENAELKLKEKSVIKLDNENVLYVRDWRK